MSVESFVEVARLVSEVSPKVDAAQRYDLAESVIIETLPMIINGAMQAKIWGPYKDADEAHNYIRIKRDRHRLSNAKHHGDTGGDVTSDRELVGHPGFQYRVVPLTGYFAKYLGQIALVALTGLMGVATHGENAIAFATPDDQYGILDEDEGDNDE